VRADKDRVLHYRVMRTANGSYTCPDVAKLAKRDFSDLSELLSVLKGSRQDSGLPVRLTSCLQADSHDA
jgi:hypothetical protein